MRRSSPRLAYGKWFCAAVVGLAAIASCRDLDAPVPQLELTGGTSSSSGGAGGTLVDGSGGTSSGRSGESGSAGTAGIGQSGAPASAGAGASGAPPTGGLGGSSGAAAGEGRAPPAAGAGGSKDTPLDSWTPHELSNLDLWLRADANFDAAGPIEVWSDESDKNNDARQEDTLVQPSWNARAFAGRPGVRFDGNAWLGVTDGETTRPDKEAFVVAVAFLHTSEIDQTWGGGNALISKHSPSDYPYLGFALMANCRLGPEDGETKTGELAARINGETWQSDLTVPAFYVAFTPQSDLAVYNDGYPRVVLMTRRGAELAIRINGHEHDHEYVYPWVVANGTGHDMLIGGREAEGQGIKGVIAEIVFARLILPSEVELIERYLLRKYADVIVDGAAGRRALP